MNSLVVIVVFAGGGSTHHEHGCRSSHFEVFTITFTPLIWPHDDINNKQDTRNTS